MDNKTVDAIAWWIPFRKLRNSVREVLNTILDISEFKKVMQDNNIQLHTLQNQNNEINNKLDILNYKSNLLLRENLKLKILSQKTIKIVVGSGHHNYENFISTDIDLFDITNKNDWSFYFAKNSISNILAEHVLEHIDYNQTKEVLSMAYLYLKMGGKFRIAIPDGFHPSKDYIDYVKPNGNGPGCDDHKILYNYKLIQNLFKDIGFEIDFLEYWDENKNFHFKKF